ncbi:MAG: serine/threonine protein kinase [Labilithrix sp.]|nr:serine/threonine protein kinase [Labilithrix sp.]MCW5813571.1 serine/threonine protein kinase [Labilithrix sp.]
MDPSTLQPGYRLDRYELLCPLAYGGMASVWLARFGGRLGFERMVVVKMILPQYSQDPRFQEMFLDEARIASKIEHANVARILDVGEEQGNYFIVMEWVDGDSLSKILRAAEQRKEKVPAGVALRICADAAAGLHAAHELKDRDGTLLGVVHRDVSPQNILVGNNGTTSIIDFGVAKARDRISQETSAGQLKGKIRYMAPEQAVGGKIDHRADVWAIGAMLYEAFTGDPPYDGVNEVATLHKLTSGQPPPPLDKEKFHPAICAIVDKALAHDATNRFASALELSQALEAALVTINEPTGAAQVAQYTGQLLAERKAARRRAVDTALEQAKKRDSGGTNQPASAPNIAVGPPSQGTIPLIQPPVNLPSTPSMPSVTPHEVPSTPSSQRQIDMTGPVRPSPAADYAQHGLGESPSATSNSTLGSANMEYPPVSQVDPVLAARRRRYIGAATLGVFGAAALVGVILIISSAVMRRSDPDPKAAARVNEPPPAETTLPDPPEPASTIAAPPEPAPVEPAPDPTPPSAPDPTPDPAPDPTPPPSAASAAPVVPPKTPTTASGHKWTPAGTGTGKTGTKKVDRGF